MSLELTKTMMDTLALAVRHHRLSGDTVSMTFHPDTPHARALLLGKYMCRWYDGVFPGRVAPDITINMTADESTLKQLSTILFDD